MNILFQKKLVEYYAWLDKCLTFTLVTTKHYFFDVFINIDYVTLYSLPYPDFFFVYISVYMVYILNIT